MVLAVASVSGACTGVNPSVTARADVRRTPPVPAVERPIRVPVPAVPPGKAPAPPPGKPPSMEVAAAPLDLTTGMLVFEGLAAEQLASIRVIPEDGLVLFEPSNGTFSGVDGFWRRGERRWFKVPGGTRVDVRPSEAGGFPAEGSGTGLTADGLSLQITASPVSTLTQQLKGPAAAAGWQPDHGASAHPTDYPF